MRTVTTAQEEIKAKISGELWDRQMVWNQKKDLYGDILTVATDLSQRWGNYSF
jgi:hypothetical protein